MTDKRPNYKKCSKNQDMQLIADIARIVSWSKLWDLALNNGLKCVNALRAFVHIVLYPSHSSRVCPICDINGLDCSLLAHILSSHVDTSSDASDILNSLWASAPTQASTDLNLSSSPNFASDSDSDKDFSRFFDMIYPLHNIFSHWP